ncbi:MAG: hypothetical protein LBF22_10810 [Deltaproteobacteria bacterium]|jgi:hypothetical protein|nr:hypothetical protein [Deltaproteobacteria bacterium]
MKNFSPLNQALLILVLFFAFLLTFMEIKARSELNSAREQISNGNLQKGIIHYFQALNWYAPTGASQTAARELSTLAKDLNDAGKKTEAYHAYLRLRAGLIASRSFYLPNTDLIKEANIFLADYLARQKLGENASPTELKKETASFFTIYDSAPQTREFWKFIVVIGFFTWTLGGVKLIFLLFQKEFQDSPWGIRLNNAKHTLVIFCFGYMFWFFGMYLA